VWPPAPGHQPRVWHWVCPWSFPFSSAIAPNNVAQSQWMMPPYVPLPPQQSSRMEASSRWNQERGAARPYCLVHAAVQFTRYPDRFCGQVQRSQRRLAPGFPTPDVPRHHLLNHLRVSGATVATESAHWTPQQKLAALSRGYHQSAKHVGMIQKG
jgi:hypothetical protein